MFQKLYTLLAISLTISFVQAQDIIPVAFDLKAPIDVTADADGNLWITESGTGFNDGQVVRLNTADQSLDTIISGLPSYFDFMSEELQGPLSARMMADGRIFVNQGAGIDTASASIIEFHIDDYNTNGTLSVSDYRSIVKEGEWVLANGYAESNPYSFVFDENGNYIIADAAANAIVKYDVSTQSFSVIADMPSFQNPLPFGPPFIEPVPTKILTHPDGGWLVSTLTGFPFVDGVSKVYHVHTDGSMSIYAEGLTLVTDMEFDPNDDQLIVQQFAKFGEVDSSLTFIFGSAQAIKIDTEGNLDTLLSGYGPSPGMTIAADGSLYMTHLFLGQLLRAEGLLTDTDHPIISTEGIDLFPNPNNGAFTVALDLPQASPLSYQLLNLQGQVMASGQLGDFGSGQQQIPFGFTGLNLPSGQYYLQIRASKQWFTTSIIKNN